VGALVVLAAIHEACKEGYKVLLKGKLIFNGKHKI